MPSPQPPLILVDNVFDRINLYPLATLSSKSGFLTGRDPQYAADYRRERTYFQTALTAGPQIQTDLGVGNSAVADSIWIDRGHNLWGRTINLDGSTDGFVVDVGNPLVFSLTVPAQGTVGGDPTTGWCVTEEGALYTLPTNLLARRSWRIADTGIAAWTIPGIILGKRVQLLGYSSVIDEDAGDRNDRSEAGFVMGYDGSDRTYSARKIEIRLAQIGGTEYDAAIRGLRRTLFDINQPAIVCMNYGTNPERAWLYKYSGKSWSSPKSRVHRGVSIPMAEVGPLIR